MNRNNVLFIIWTRLHVNHATRFREEAVHAQAHTHTHMTYTSYTWSHVYGTCIFDRSFSRVFIEICISLKIALNTYPIQDVGIIFLKQMCANCR